MFLGATFLLGFIFVYLQAHEYGEAYAELGLQLSTGIYGSTFFMLTGFHGLHVTIGAIMLTVIWLRVMKGTSPRSVTSRSKPLPGTGTSSTWCGSACSSSSTGSERFARPHGAACTGSP